MTEETSYPEVMLLAMIGELFVENKIKQEQIEILRERLGQDGEDTIPNFAKHARRGRKKGSDAPTE